MISLSNINRFSTFFHWLILLYICSKKHKNPITPCVCCHTTWRIINIKKQATNDALPGSVATYLRCGGVVNNQIKKGLLLTLSVKKKSKFVNIWQSYKQEGGCLVHLANTLLKVKESARHNPPFSCFYAKYADFNFFSLTESAINLSQFGY